MEDIEIDEYPDGGYGICFGGRGYVRYLTEGIVKLEVELESDSKEVEDAKP